MRHIYVASSWKNAATLPDIAGLLRAAGHEVFLFCEREAGHFVFNAGDWKGEDLSSMTAKQAFHHEAFRAAYASDKAGLDWADTVVLVLPAGKSTHLEAGYGAGQGKDVFVYGAPVPGEYDAMYGFARAICETCDELLIALRLEPLAWRKNALVNTFSSVSTPEMLATQPKERA